MRAVNQIETELAEPIHNIHAHKECELEFE